MTEIAVREDDTLALTADQHAFTDRQRAALAHIGVEHAVPGDLEVFFHVCQRSGLDPFARQIYMISRQVSERDASGNWVKVTKQTIQTGIDGFRLIGRRAANKAGHAVSVGAPEWCHEDGSWRPVWRSAWGVPVGARVTIQRDGQPFTAVALFDEYKQTKRDGGLTQMWAQRPAGQIAKCAEALAWRMAFPQDLSGIYSDDEMQQADSQPWDGTTQPPRRTVGLAAALEKKAEPAETGEALTDRTRGRMFALFGERGITDRDEQLRGINHICGSDYTSRSEMTEADAQRIIATLEQSAAVQPPLDGGEA